MQNEGSIDIVKMQKYFQNYVKIPLEYLSHKPYFVNCLSGFLKVKIL